MSAFSEGPMKTIGNRMLLLRHQAKLTQIQFARILHISSSHYSKLEIGLGTIGSKLLQSFRKVSVPLEWLIDGKDPMPDTSDFVDKPKTLEPLFWKRVRRRTCSISWTSPCVRAVCAFPLMLL